MVPTRGGVVLLWNVKKKEKTTLSTVRKHWGETQINLTSNNKLLNIKQQGYDSSYKYHDIVFISNLPLAVHLWTRAKEKKNAKTNFSQRDSQGATPKPSYRVFGSLSST